MNRPHDFLMRASEAFGKPVCRLGLASRGSGSLAPQDVLEAVRRGVNFLNIPGASEGPAERDAFSQAIASLSSERESLVICMQLAARTAREAAAELRSVLHTLETDYLDVVTLYYVETAEEWESLTAPGGVLSWCRTAKTDGLIRRIGVTSHQRPLAAQMAASGLLDVLMIRYNAAHRGAEREVFPVTDTRQVPVVAYTALRWGVLLRPTRLDPDGYVVPPATSWYRFVLQSPSVSVVLAAPASRAELVEDLQVLDASGPLAEDEFQLLAAHGRRVCDTAGSFP